MLGAIVGDTVGSVYEFHNIHTTQFPLFQKNSRFTDDTVMTIAVARWLLMGEGRTQRDLEDCMVALGRQFPHAGYGGGFRCWLFAPEQLMSYNGEPRSTMRHPYNSFGNGSAMRVSAVGWYFDMLEETEYWAEQSAIITHNHPEGVKGAQATAAAIFLARTGHDKATIREYIELRYGYDLSRTCDQIRPTYSFNETCQNTVPEALCAFLESRDFESCLRLGVSLGGDTDTLCAIACGVAEAYYGGIPSDIREPVWDRLPSEFQDTLRQFRKEVSSRKK